MKRKREETESQVIKDFVWRESLGKEKIFLERKKALIYRDPLTQELLNELQRYNPQLGKSPQLKEILNQLEKKWFVSIVIPAEVNYAAQSHGFQPDKIYERTVEKKIAINGNEFLETLFCKPTNEPFVIQNRFKNEPIVFCIPTDSGDPYLFGQRFFNDNLTIQIDLNLINQNDARYVKNTVWKIVKKYLKEGIPDNSYIMKSLYGMEAPGYDPEELTFLYHCKEKTFSNNLRYYDMKMAGLTFRLIALVEKTKEPSKREERYKQLVESARIPKVHKPEPGESRVREGFKQIYKAIQRNSPPIKEQDIVTEKKYNCPEHGKNCNLECSHLQSWLKRKLPKEISLIGKRADEKELEYLAAPKSGKISRKKTDSLKQD